MVLSRALTFAGNPLDRANLKRLDVAWLTAAQSAEHSRILPLSHGKPLMRETAGQALQLCWLSPTAFKEATGQIVFLGVEADLAHFACDVGPDATGFAAHGNFVDPLAALQGLPDAEGAIAAQARGILLWHERHRFCSNCGAASESADGGWKRFCGACKTEHFPRTDPVAIMLVVHGDEVLLGRKNIFPPGMYTALAGFMEPGETIEEAVAREVLEEAGVTVGDVRYLASQPWPYPASLMIGCIAEATSREITVDTTELDDARWFTRSDCRLAVSGAEGPLKIPPRYAIAHHLIRHWVNEG